MASSNNPNSSSSSSSSGSPTAAQSRRPSRQVSSPWTQIVRGGESVPTIAAAAAAAAPSSPQSKPPIEPIADASASSSSPLTVEAAAGEEKPEGNAGKKPVWKRPSNGGAAASEVGPVMGASSWPALSEAANKSSSDSLKSLGDVVAPVPVSQV
ncbi:hypothetical protein F2Q70_00033530 [Brassica cretica]|uniref:Uncharacterized protein n=1 Tax=Brassica cretica TaxID=69181 RepID=A0A8S9FNW5_BRACR|nr:hypothetical protein F2Q70_00033530 [Brassica cretica]